MPVEPCLSYTFLGIGIDLKTFLSNVQDGNELRKQENIFRINRSIFMKFSSQCTYIVDESVETEKKRYKE